MTSDTSLFPRKHISLTKGATTVSMNLCDGNGKNDATAIRQDLQPRLSIKMAQGGTKHSDYEPPYASLEQRDWTGGRGQDDFDLDESRFFDSNDLNSWSSRGLMMGPRPHYARGIRNMDTNYPNEEYKALSLGATSIQRAASFVASASYTTARIHFCYRIVGNPDGLTVGIYQNSSGSPGAVIASASPTGTAPKEKEWTWAYATVAAELTASTTYHVVFTDASTLPDAENYYEIMGYDASGSVYNTSWGASTVAPYFRVVDAERTYSAKFFNYTHIPHAVLEYDDGGAPKIFMSGDFGRATASTSTTLTDSSKTWVADEWIGSTLLLYDGTGSERLKRTFVITDNTTNALSVPGWEVQPDTSTYYCIISNGLWKEITGHGITSGPITDVLSVNNLVYIARGDRNDAVMMRYPRLATGGFTNLTGTRGTFFQYAKESTGTNRLWKSNRSLAGSVDKSSVPWGTYTGTTSELDWGYEVSVTNGNMEADSSWSAVSTPTTNERSNSQAHSGTYSWKLVCDASGEGITQTVAVTAGSRYNISCWVHLVAGSAYGVKLMMGGEEIDDIGTGTTGEWLYLSGVRYTTSNSETVQILSDGGASSFYVDDVYISARPAYLPASGIDGRITGLVRYGEPERLWVITDNGLFMEDNGTLLPIPIQEMSNVSDDRNGVASVVHDVYLFFSFLDGVERYYKSNLDDVGPNRDEGLPITRRGSVVSLVGYPGRIYAAIDGGGQYSNATVTDDGVVESFSPLSSVLLYNELGWHEPFRSKAGRIRNLQLQSLLSTNTDRLILDSGSDIIHLPVSLNPLTDSGYRYTNQSQIETSWMYYGKKDIEKFWKTIKIVFDCDYTDWSIFAYYKTDNDTGWTYIGEASISSLTDSMSETLPISSNNDVTGKRIKFKLILQTRNALKTPVIKAIVVDFVEQVPTKNSWTMTFLAEDNNVTLQGTPAMDRVETGIEQLEEWMNDPSPATIGSWLSTLDGKEVKILSMTYRPFMVDPVSQKEKLICTLTVIET